MMLPQAEGWFALDSIDLADVRSINLKAGWQTAPTSGIELELRLDAPDGKLIGTGTYACSKKRG